MFCAFLPQVNNLCTRIAPAVVRSLFHTQKMWKDANSAGVPENQRTLMSGRTDFLLGRKNARGQGSDIMPFLGEIQSSSGYMPGELTEGGKKQKEVDSDLLLIYEDLWKGYDDK